jgi:hypothetical protein
MEPEETPLCRLLRKAAIDTLCFKFQHRAFCVAAAHSTRIGDVPGSNLSCPIKISIPSCKCRDSALQCTTSFEPIPAAHSQSTPHHIPSCYLFSWDSHSVSRCPAEALEDVHTVQWTRFRYLSVQVSTGQNKREHPKRRVHSQKDIKLLCLKIGHDIIHPERHWFHNTLLPTPWRKALLRKLTVAQTVRNLLFVY